jgi:hypothetical protein
MRRLAALFSSRVQPWHPSASSLFIPTPAYLSLTPYARVCVCVCVVPMPRYSDRFCVCVRACVRGVWRAGRRGGGGQEYAADVVARLPLAGRGER